MAEEGPFKCSVPYCGRGVYRTTLCRTHHVRKNVFGDVMMDIPIRPIQRKRVQLAKPPTKTRTTAKNGPLTLERLRELLIYDPATGEFTRRVDIYRKYRAGQKAGSRDRRGYVFLRIDYRPYTAHRLAWLYVYGVWPARDVDHIDGDCSNNRIANLRLATMSQNIANSKLSCRNKPGSKGVSWATNERKWKAQITFQSRNKHLGYFNSKEEAAACYREAATRLFGEFARTS